MIEGNVRSGLLFEQLEWYLSQFDNLANDKVSFLAHRATLELDASASD